MSKCKFKKEYFFREGNTYTNTNSYKYQVEKVINNEKVLFKRLSDGEEVLATLPKLFLKNNKVMLSWAYGKYFAPGTDTEEIIRLI